MSILHMEIPPFIYHHVTHLNPTLEELADIKTAVSEAVTNAIIHGYENLAGYSRHGESIPAYSIVHPGKVRMHCVLDGDMLSIEITDQGKGIEDIIRGFHTRGVGEGKRDAVCRGRRAGT